MNRSELVDKITEQANKSGSNLKKAHVELLLTETLSIIKSTVKKQDITLIGFGTFTKTKRKARKGRNPQTGKEINIPARTVPKFKAAKDFKEAVR